MSEALFGMVLLPGAPSSASSRNIGLSEHRPSPQPRGTGAWSLGFSSGSCALGITPRQKALPWQASPQLFPFLRDPGHFLPCYAVSENTLIP